MAANVELNKFLGLPAKSEKVMDILSIFVNISIAKNMADIAKYHHDGTSKINETLTLYNVILRIGRNFLETRENIKISTHPFYHINLD